jgi:hypothetical protein
VKYAEDNGGNRAAGRQYAISETLVRDWRMNQDTIKEMQRKKRARRGKDALWPELEVVGSVTDIRDYGCSVNTIMIRQKALSVVQYDEAYEDIRDEFIASEGCGCGGTWMRLKVSLMKTEDRMHAFEAADQESDNEMTDSQRIRAFDGYDDNSDFEGFDSEDNMKFPFSLGKMLFYFSHNYLWYIFASIP